MEIRSLKCLKSATQTSGWIDGWIDEELHMKIMKSENMAHMMRGKCGNIYIHKSHINLYLNY